MRRTTSEKTAAVILDGGNESGMRSSIPRLLHPCADVPLVEHVIRTALARHCDPIVVVLGPRSTRVREVVTAQAPEAPLTFVTRHAAGMASALGAAVEALTGFDGRVVLVPADMPLLLPDTLGRLVRAAKDERLALLSADGASRTPHGASDTVCVCDAKVLRRLAGAPGHGKTGLDGRLGPLVRALAGSEADEITMPDATELLRVATRVELGVAEAFMRRRIRLEHQRRGVTLRDPEGTFIGAAVRIERDVVLGVGVQLNGDVRIGRGARIEGPTVIQDAVIGAGALVHAFSHIEGASVAPGASVGPFARLRPGARLEQGAKVGNFVEVKKSRIGKGAKANHLAYLGDAQVGAGTNVGAGTITCNYDGGPVKHPTTIEKDVFIGSNATLVAPVRLGRGAFVAAGSTITKDVPADALAFGRARQSNLDGYAKKLRERIKKGKR